MAAGRRAERLAATSSEPSPDLADITVLIPARDEATCIATTLQALAAQGPLGGIIVIDDQSSDGTGDIARAQALPALQVLTGTTPPAGWSGKLWALHQGFAHVATARVLLLDADIELAPGILAALSARMRDEGLALASVMATLHMGNAWEKLLLPPFVFFFKLIYPFALANDPRSRIAAAAGGLILLDSATLRAIGGFAGQHDAIIDDCTLAARVKRHGGRTWLGLSREVRAIRPTPRCTTSGTWSHVRLSPTALLDAVARAVLGTAPAELRRAVLALGSGRPAAIALGAVALLAMGRPIGHGAPQCPAPCLHRVPARGRVPVPGHSLDVGATLLVGRTQPLEEPQL